MFYVETEHLTQFSHILFMLQRANLVCSLKKLKKQHAMLMSGIGDGAVQQPAMVGLGKDIERPVK